MLYFRDRKGVSKSGFAGKRGQSKVVARIGSQVDTGRYTFAVVKDFIYLQQPHQHEDQAENQISQQVIL